MSGRGFLRIDPLVTLVATFRVTPGRVAADGDENAALVLFHPHVMTCLDDAQELWASGAYSLLLRSEDEPGVSWRWDERGGRDVRAELPTIPDAGRKQ